MQRNSMQLPLRQDKVALAHGMRHTADAMLVRRLRAGRAGTLAVLLGVALGGHSSFGLGGAGGAAAWLTPTSAASRSTGKPHRSWLLAGCAAHRYQVHKAPTARGAVNELRGAMQGLKGTDLGVESMLAMIALVENEMVPQLEILGEVTDAQEALTDKCRSFCSWSRIGMKGVGHASEETVMLLERIVEISTRMKGEPSTVDHEVKKLPGTLSKIASILEQVRQWLSHCAGTFEEILHDLHSLIARMRVEQQQTKDNEERCSMLTFICNMALALAPAAALVGMAAFMRSAHTYSLPSAAWKADVGKAEADGDNLNEVEFNLLIAAASITDRDAKYFDLKEDVEKAQKQFTDVKERCENFINKRPWSLRSSAST